MSTYYSQIAFVCEDANALRAWYSRLFGFLPSGRTIYAGKLSTRVMGIEDVNTRCYWSLDGNESKFQLEFFDFRSPQRLPRPEPGKAAMPGYNRLGIFTWQFQACLDALSDDGRLERIDGENGQRIAYCTDPEGNSLEVYERDPLPEAEWTCRARRSVVRLIRLNTHGADSVLRSWEDALGLEPRTMPKWLTDRQSLGLDGLSFPSYLQGGGLVMEICETREAFPGGERPPLYQHGLMNFAINTASRAEWDGVFNKALQSGFRANGKALEAGIFKVMYVNDPMGNSIELLYPRTFAYPLTGFLPSEAVAEESISVGADVPAVWKALAEVLPKGLLVGSENGVEEASESAHVVARESGHYLHYRLRRPFAPGYSAVIRLDSQGETVRVSWQAVLSAPVPLIRALVALAIRCSVRAKLGRVKKIAESAQTSSIAL
ncbi:hypothetical protein [Marinobacter sp. F4216]|uniref:hypothetical protein n=1 Tax=Marinobacter sp. F4216 TaxID=2874281 RepID=UPI001CBB8853|nr:hypothetical protein [Marinobacter sp. F4216]MBZ2168369.1 hypothetical protein [Marinobacter sp. F4216]